jgi:membrane-associated phospholipid phosphatase
MGGFIAVALVLLVPAMLVDQAIYQRLELGADSEEWYRLLRVLGWAPTWLAIAAGLVLHGRSESGPFLRRPSVEAGLMLAMTIAVCAATADAMKLLIRRVRPNLAEGAFAWRSVLEGPLDSSGLAMPSSHAMVAFGAALILCRLFPRGWPVWLAAALGCGFTRFATRSHFLSDVIAAALFAELVVRFLWNWHQWNGVQRLAAPALGHGPADAAVRAREARRPKPPHPAAAPPELSPT